MSSLRLFFILFCVWQIVACSKTPRPAPVVSLSTKVATAQNLTVIEGDRYVVQKGDTLFAIAFYSGNDYKHLSKINNIDPPYIIQEGQIIQLIARKPTDDNKPNNQLAQTEQNLNKIEVDQTNQQAYGDINHNKLRENLKKTGFKSNIPYNLKEGNSKWVWPASGTHTIATVGSDGSKRGLDIKGTLGANIYSSASGKVVYAGNALKGYGNLIIIKHNDDYLSAYAHNHAILVSEQMYVEQGQKIATMGSSGAKEVMLHFEIRKKGKSVDPFKYLPPKSD